MTLKHINFIDSPVMRELERRVIKTNQVPLLPLTEIIKKQAATQVTTQYSSTNNLFLDLIKLAEGLRAKGFVQNAEVLEEKIFAYKKASEQYNSELHAAHPDGDITMGEASDGLGDVETLESAHEKIVEVVKKNPTGKQAAQNLIDNILRASEDILAIKKKAQDTIEESAEDIFSGKSATRIATIKEINNFLAGQFPKISSILRGKDVDPSKWGFAYEGIKNYPTIRGLYASYVEPKIDPSVIDNFFQISEKLYGKNFQGDAYSRILGTLQSYADNKDFNNLISYANLVGGGLGNKYFTGSQPSSSKRRYAAENPDKANNPIFQDNPNSVWVWYDANIYTFTYDDFSVDQNKLAAAAREIQQTHYNNFQELFSEDKFNAATAKLQEQIKKLMAPWEEVNGFFDKIPELPTNATSSASLIMAINSQAEKLRPYLEDGVAFKTIKELGTHIWMDWTPNLPIRAAEAVKEISNTVGFLNTKPLSVGDVIVTDTKQVEQTIFALGKGFFNAAQDLNPKSKEYADYRKNYNELARILSVVKNGLGKPYAFIYEHIKNSFPNATTYEKLVEEVSAFANEYSDILARASVNNDIVKQAQLARRTPAATAITTSKPISSSKPAASVSNRATLGLAKANMNDPKEVAVATMQQHLAYFAEALSSEAAKTKFSDYDPQDIARIIRTGPKANPAVNTYDGKWGTETQAALELANKYLKQLGLSSLDTKARYSNRVTSADAESAAKSNSNILLQAIQILGGRGGVAGAISSGGTVYDRLPNKINWSEVKYPLMEHRNTVTSNDMSSLGSLYDLIVKNGWLQPEYVKDSEGFEVEGFSARNWAYIVQWFQRRAQFIYNSSIRTDKNAAALAKQYYDAAKRLEGQLQSFFASYGYSSQNETDIIDIEALRQHSSSVDVSKGRGEGRILERRPGMRDRFPEGLQYAGYRPTTVGEGTDWRSPAGGGEEGPPIGPDGVINLASRWFYGLADKLGISHNPLLNPDIFRRYPAADLARTFYASSGGDMDQQARQQALVATGLEVEGYDEGAGDYIVYYYDPVTRRKTRTYAMKVPAYNRAYRARLTAGPIRSFGALLQSISSALGPAIAEWMQSTQPNDAAKQAEEAWHVEWQRLLGLKANEAAGA
jgi:hypothetical protein